MAAWPACPPSAQPFVIAAAALAVAGLIPERASAYGVPRAAVLVALLLAAAWAPPASAQSIAVTGTVTSMQERTGRTGARMLTGGPAGGAFVWSSACTPDGVIKFSVASDATGASGCWSREWDGHAVNARWARAAADGATDDTDAVKDALTAAAAYGAALDLGPPSARYKLTSTVTVGADRVVRGGTVVPALPAGGGKLFDLTGAGTVFEDVAFDGDGLAATLTAPSYLVNVSADRVTVQGLTFKSVTQSDGADPMLLVTHAVYVEEGADVVVRDNKFYGVSGAAVFVKHAQRVRVADNVIHDTGWYAISLDEHVQGAIVEANSIVQDETYYTPPGTRGLNYWGGGINLMSQGALDSEPPLTDVVVRGNYLKGEFSYGAVLRILSCTGCLIEGNVIEGIVDGNGFGIGLIRIDARYVDYDPGAGTDHNNGPSRSVTVRNNVLRASTVANGIQCIYANNQNGNAPIAAAAGLLIEGNRCEQGPSGEDFAGGVLVHGGSGPHASGGWGDVVVRNNTLECDPTGSPVPGCLGLIGQSYSPVRGVTITDNRVRWTGSGTAGVSDVGVYVGQYAGHVSARRNEVEGFLYNLRTIYYNGADATLDVANPVWIDGNGYRSFAAGGADEILQRYLRPINTGPD